MNILLQLVQFFNVVDHQDGHDDVVNEHHEEDDIQQSYLSLNHDDITIVENEMDIDTEDDRTKARNEKKIERKERKRQRKEKKLMRKQQKEKRCKRCKGCCNYNRRLYAWSRVCAYNKPCCILT